ncbi:MAG: hypothetical protein NC340_10500 [Ruminococcus flavefaciens]|nr:hypothetical protein [Ruminococcus flavefaciens]MCM1231374.1 hypothetical protein [Ruminococcus flavefaciens]
MSIVWRKFFINKILKLIFEQWQEDKLDGRAETAAYDYFSRRSNYTLDEANKNHDYLGNALYEAEERAFLAGFNTAVRLKDLVDGKTEI